jgi:hypothetical protein
MKNLFLLFISICISSIASNAQELNCKVEINSQKIQGTDKRIFESLETAIFEFMNNRKWTEDIVEMDEKIDCSITLTLNTKISADEFEGEVLIQSRRPVYKSSYNSTLLNHKEEKFKFKYLEFQSLEFDINTYNSNLTSFLAYYAYYILGLDYDTFSPEGGTPFFQKAQTIVSNAQNSAEFGWKASENTKNRYWLVENMLNQRYEPLRECMYKYHRIGLDNMSMDMNNSRKAVIEGIELQKKVYDAVPGSIMLTLFFTAKSDEIINIFSQAQIEEKTKIVPILNQIDPSNILKYQKIMRGN